MPNYLLTLEGDSNHRVSQMAETANPDDACAKVNEQWPQHRIIKIVLVDPDLLKKLK